MDEEFNLKDLEDESERKAIKHALQSHEQEVLFLEDEETGRNSKMVAYRLSNEWRLRILPDELSQEVLSKFLHYTMDLVDCVKQSITDSNYGSYYSLRPLIYGGEYWLDTVCRQEYDRYQDLKESRVLSVIVIPWNEDWSLFELVESLRRGDRVGYFEDLLGIVLPFTNETQMDAVANRLKNTFDIDDTYCWLVEDDFDNLHELSTMVKGLL